LAKPINEVGRDAVRIEASSYQIPGTHPSATGPFSERQICPGSPTGGGNHLDSFQGFFYSPRRERMRVREGMGEDGRQITVDNRDAVLRTTVIRRLEVVEKLLADGVGRVVLVDTSPVEHGVPDVLVDPGV
jgi:hypothetical protein